MQIPDPIDSAFRDWGTDPYGGGHHLWKPGVNAWVVARDIRRSFEDEKRLLRERLTREYSSESSLL